MASLPVYVKVRSSGHREAPLIVENHFLGVMPARQALAFGKNDRFSLKIDGVLYKVKVLTIEKHLDYQTVGEVKVLGIELDTMVRVPPVRAEEGEA